MAAVELRGLRKRYGALTVVDGVDLTIPDAAFVCLLGPSGCGKTTLLRLLAGFVAPDAGEIVVGGRTLSRPGAVVPPEQRCMSMIFQSYALWPHMTVEQNIAYGLQLRDVPRDQVAQRVRRIAAVTKLDALLARSPGELSGGQQQRVALARALAVEPQTMLLDEPLSNLDANLREEMRFEIRRLHDEFRYTTVYVTHDQSEAMATADLIVVLQAGRVAQIGTPEDVYLRPRSEFVARFVGGTNVLPGALAGLDGVVSIRLEDVGMSGERPAAGVRATAGRVVRRVFLGSTRDYVVAAAGREVRVTTALHVDIAPGSPVWLTFPPEHCRQLDASPNGDP